MKVSKRNRFDRHSRVEMDGYLGILAPRYLGILACWYMLVCFVGRVCMLAGLHGAEPLKPGTCNPVTRNPVTPNPLQDVTQSGRGVVFLIPSAYYVHVLRARMGVHRTCR